MCRRYSSAPMPARQKYRLRARSDREIVREVEPGVTYVDHETRRGVPGGGRAAPARALAQRASLRGREPEAVRVLPRAARPERPERLPTLRPPPSGRRALSIRALLAGAAARGSAGRLRRRRRADGHHAPAAGPVPAEHRGGSAGGADRHAGDDGRSGHRDASDGGPATVGHRSDGHARERYRAALRAARPSGSRSTATKIRAPAADSGEPAERLLA